MRAVLCKAFGGPETLAVGEVPTPEPGAGEVRIRVRAAGLNFADNLLIAGKYQVRPEPPFSPGFEVAGEVDAVGAGVDGIAPGARVMAFIDYGGYAEQAVAPAGRVFAIPEAMDFATAATFPVAYGTSHVGLTRRARLQAGETLVVHGAAGGVGLTAVEIGKLLGARVIATARGAEKLALARDHGADETIDTGSEDIRDRVLELTDGRGADVIFDPVGGDVFDASRRCIAWEGRIVVVGFASGRIPEIPANHPLVKNYAVVGLYWGAYMQRDPKVIAESFDELLGWYVDGKLEPHVSGRYPMDRAADALAMLASRKSTGKLVLEI